MTRLINTTMAALVGLAFLYSACQGELKLTHKRPVNSGYSQGGGGMDGGANEGDMTPTEPTISFAQIQKDLKDAGCTAAVAACHGPTTTKSTLKLTDADVQGNYEQLKKRVNTTDGQAEESLLIKKIRDEKGGDPDKDHGGGPFCGMADLLGPTGCNRWITWIKCGAKFEAVKLSDPECGS